MKNGRLFVEYETLTIGKDVNGQDKKDLNVILERMEQADKDRDQMHTDIKFIKKICSTHIKDCGQRVRKTPDSERTLLSGEV